MQRATIDVWKVQSKHPGEISGDCAAVGRSSNDTPWKQGYSSP